MSTRKQQGGFTLVEALIALLVLSIGLLGVAAMQLKALQSAHAGYQRAVASLAAQDVVELLWEELDMNSSSCPTSSALDLADWTERWGNFLPSLNGSPVTVEPSSISDDCVYEIQIRWQEERFEGEGAPIFEYTARLPKGGS